MTKLYLCCRSKISDEEEEVQGPSGTTPPIPEEVETRRDEANPSAAGASSSRPRKLPTRRPRALSPAGAETSDSGKDDLGLGEVPVYPPPKRAQTASELVELGQARLNWLVLYLSYLFVNKLLMFFLLFICVRCHCLAGPA